MNERLHTLFKKQQLQDNSSEEKEELLKLMADQANEREVNELLKNQWDEINEDHDLVTPVFQPGQGEEILAKLLTEHVYPSQGMVKKIKLWPRIAAAASIILCCSAGIYFYQHRKHLATTNDLAQNDIKPGTNGAVLTLANGKKIILESAKNGKLAQQNGSQVNKAGDSLLVYQPTAANAAITYNTLETPKGRQVEVELPDGSKVWLNAASSLKYPTAFAGKERLVELTGEADFKVTPNAQMPFRVKTNGQVTEDIGTEFNIDAYADEPNQRTTLLEGAIKVNSTLLEPGQQAVLTGGKLSLTTANTAEVTAWKNGDFIFNNVDIRTVMRQLARWYDIDVSYEGQPNTNGFNAQISRRQNISVILKALQRTNGVRFRIEGRRVTVIE